MNKIVDPIDVFHVHNQSSSLNMRPFSLVNVSLHNEVSSSVVTALFHSTSNSEVNLLRHAMDYIPTIAVGWVTFDHNDSARIDEIIAHRLGLCPIVQPRTKDEHSKLVNLVSKIDISADRQTRVVTTRDFVDVPFAYPIDIVHLRPGQRLRCQLRFVSGIDHVKHRPLALFTFRRLNQGYFSVSKDLTPNARPQTNFVRNNIKFSGDIDFGRESYEETLASAIGYLPVEGGDEGDIFRLEYNIPGPVDPLAQFGITDPLYRFNLRQGVSLVIEGVLTKNDVAGETYYRPLQSPYDANDSGYHITFKLNGMMEADDILDKAHEHMKDAKADPPQNLFSQLE